MFPFNSVVITIWVVFWLYWLVSAFGVKRSTNPQLRRFAGIRLGFFLLIVVLFRFHNVQSYSLKSQTGLHSDWIRIAGLIVVLLGLSLAIWARLYLGKNWGMPMAQKEDPELVMSGPYHYIRHPIYTGILLAVIGSSLASSLFWLLIFVFSGTYFIYSAVQEEKLMTKEFPKIYPSYKGKTKMLIPFIF